MAVTEVIDFFAKKENFQNYFEFHFLHNHGKPRILVSFTKFRPILGVYHSCCIGLTTDNYLNSYLVFYDLTK